MLHVLTTHEGCTVLGLELVRQLCLVVASVREPLRNVLYVLRHLNVSSR
jgi:hypothetical protein